MKSTLTLNKLNVTIFGGSHSQKIGTEVEGLPAGARFNPDALQAFLERRAPGRAAYATTRREPDQAIFERGVSDGVITDGSLRAVIHNTDTRSGDYGNLRDVPRPAHADYPAAVKYHGKNQTAGGGHFSARMTAPLCIAGGICLQLLEEAGIRIGAHIARIGHVDDVPFDPLAPQINAIGSFPTISEERGAQMREVIEQARLRADSIGGMVECAATGLPVGLGEHMFYGLENILSQVIFGIPAVKGIEFGAGFAVAGMYGSQNNDPYYYDADTVRTKTNHHGGVLGGMSTGMPLIFRCAFKPTPSIGIPQQSVSLSERKNTILTIKGRHDPCVVPRAVPVVEAATAIALYDAYLTAKDEENHGLN